MKHRDRCNNCRARVWAVTVLKPLCIINSLSMAPPLPPSPEDNHQSSESAVLLEGPWWEYTSVRVLTHTRAGMWFSWPKVPVGKCTSDKLWHQTRHKERPVWGLRVLPGWPITHTHTHTHIYTHTHTHILSHTHVNKSHLLSNTHQLQTADPWWHMLGSKPDDRKKTPRLCLPFIHLARFCC